VYNWNNSLLMLDQDATDRKRVPVFDKLPEVSGAQTRNIERMTALIEEYCEIKPPGLPKKSKTISQKNTPGHRSVRPANSLAGW
jgi:hypothetical protein